MLDVHPYAEPERAEAVVVTPQDVEFVGTEDCALRGTVYPVAQPRARVLMVHGMGEHSGRYSELGVSLAARGFLTVGYDHRGHGRSDGKRGDAESVGQLVDDLERVKGEVAKLGDPTMPFFVFGHSMGGLITLCHLGRPKPGFDAAILSAPWLRTLRGPGPLLMGVARVIERIAPRAALRTGLRTDVLTRDPAEAEAYRSDPLIHGHISPRLFLSVERAQQEVLSRPEGYGLPMLFMVPDSDGLVNPQPTLDLARRLAPHHVELEILEGVRHEPLHDLGREEVVKRVGDWFEGIV